MRDRLILAIPWRELTRNMTRRLSRRGLSVRRTFDLQEARRSLRNGDTVASEVSCIERAQPLTTTFCILASGMVADSQKAAAVPSGSEDD
jgi:hypothetical protein